MHLGELLYETGLRVAVPALRLAAPWHAKLRRGVRGRHVALHSLRAWAVTARDATRPLVWLHAPSVGEALMTQAILAALREREPALQAVFTYFSPSAERVADRVGADWTGYLPWDRTRDMRAALAAARPDCVAFVRTEIWPVLVREARARGAGVVLVNGVLAAGSSRIGRGARALLGAAYGRLQAVGAVSAADAARFPLLGVDAARVRVTGDARFDQVWRRVQSLAADPRLLRPFRARPGPWLVAGSTWPSDEELLVSSLAALRAQSGGWRAVIAPHEPTAAHVSGLEARLRDAGLTHARLPADAEQVAVPDVDAIVVDRVGVLADLYAIADAAYVGGGFGRAGLHSVVEPAAFGLPVLYGPRHGNAQEAALLHDAGGGFVARTGPALGALLSRLAGDAELRARAGGAAREFVRSHLGGAAAGAELILAYMKRPR